MLKETRISKQINQSKLSALPLKCNQWTSGARSFKIILWIFIDSFYRSEIKKHKSCKLAFRAGIEQIFDTCPFDERINYWNDLYMNRWFEVHQRSGARIYHQRLDINYSWKRKVQEQSYFMITDHSWKMSAMTI